MNTAAKHHRSLTPQAAQILQHLKTVGSLTALEAGAIYKVRALPRRIADLKEHGHVIKRVMKKDITGQRYARYYYVETKRRNILD